MYRSIANADEIEITPEMIEAGIDALTSHYIYEFDPVELRAAITDAFAAMLRIGRGAGL